jgi:ubiquinone/menaquinone biosynthesis C-methylase UbiE
MISRDSEAVYRSAAEGFAELADTYDARMAGNPVLLLESTETLAALPDLTDVLAADFGCGTGRYAIQMCRLGAARVTGIDLVPEMLTVAARKARRAPDGDSLPVRWEQADLTDALPFPDASLDAAVCALTLTFIADLTAAFARMARTLKRGGALVVSDYHPHGLCAARAASAAVGRNDYAPYLRFTTADGEECRVAQQVHRTADLFAAAKSAGLRLDHIAEPVCDRRLANTYAGLLNMIGVPLALVLRFKKEDAP